jgi:hypothetical protein
MMNDMYGCSWDVSSLVMIFGMVERTLIGRKSDTVSAMLVFGIKVMYTWLILHKSNMLW